MSDDRAEKIFRIGIKQNILRLDRIDGVRSLNDDLSAGQIFFIQVSRFQRTYRINADSADNRVSGENAVRIYRTSGICARAQTAGEQQSEQKTLYKP